MVHEWISWLLFFFGVAGVVRGDSTASATLSATSSATPISITHILSPSFATSLRNLESSSSSHLQKAQLLWDTTEQASFTASLSVIKDSKKKAAINKIQQRFVEININQGNTMAGKLMVLHQAVVAIAEAAAREEVVSKKDSKAIKKAVETASVSIENAMKLQVKQSQKLYVVSVSSESSLKKNATTIRSVLMSDLKAVRDTAAKARTDVGSAYKALHTYTGRNDSVTIPVSVN